MARPSAEVIHEQDDNNKTWQILAAEACYVVCYRGRPVGIRTIQHTLQGLTTKYKKMTYTNLGNAIAQQRLLNRKFNCNDFSVMRVGE